MAGRLDILASSLRSTQRAIDEKRGRAKAVAQAGIQAKQQVEALERQTELLNDAVILLNGFAERRQEELQEKIEGLVTYGLRMIFGDDSLSFHIVSSQRGDTKQMDFVVRSQMEGSWFETSVLDARGGGVASVAGFLIRLIILLMCRNQADPVLFLDESFAQLSAEYEPALAEFIRELVDKTDVQIVMVTHSSAYEDVADTHYRVENRGGLSHFVRT